MGALLEEGMVTRIYLINGFRIRKQCPQGLKPNFLGLKMSELKLRPPKTIYELASREMAWGIVLEKKRKRSRGGRY